MATGIIKRDRFLFVILNFVTNLVFAGQRFVTKFRMTKKESFSGPALSGWPWRLVWLFKSQGVPIIPIWVECFKAWWVSALRVGGLVGYIVSTIN